MRCQDFKVIGHEGVHLTSNHASEILDLVEEQLAGQYTLVLNRINSYSVDVMKVYEELNSRKRIKDIVILTHRDSSRVIAGIEEKVCEHPLTIL